MTWSTCYSEDRVEHLLTMTMLVLQKPLTQVKHLQATQDFQINIKGERNLVDRVCLVEAEQLNINLINTLQLKLW